MTTTGRLPDSAFWRGRRVLLTGHSGFKGAWAALWLARMGAEVTGFALQPGGEPSLFALAGVETDVRSQIGDLRDRKAVACVVDEARPEIVLHMAAQPLVRRAIRDPVETIATNVLGTAHLLDALREADGLAAVLIVTSDKVYANAERGEVFVEADPLGGKDPYSASKAACEILAASFAQSYFAARGIPLACARGGNVIGGGDFAEDRVVPDVVRAALSDQPVVLRHPDAVRPWQHVLDCLCGYLVYAEALAKGEGLPAALNFGPCADDPVTVRDLAETMQAALRARAGWRHEPVAGSVEARTLALDSSLARSVLGWADPFAGAAGVAATAIWYRAWLDGEDMRAVTLAEIERYMSA